MKVPAKNILSLTANLPDKSTGQVQVTGNVSALLKNLTGVSRGLHEATLGEMHPVIANFSDRIVTLRRNSIIAYVEKLNDVHVVQINECEISNGRTDEKSYVTEIKVAKQIANMKFNENLTTKQRNEIVHVLLKRRNMFPSKNRPLGDCTKVTHEIDTGDNHPVKRIPWQTSYAQRMQINEQVKNMLGKGTIRESASPWSFPVVLVKTKMSPKNQDFAWTFGNLTN